MTVDFNGGSIDKTKWKLIKNGCTLASIENMTTHGLLFVKTDRLQKGFIYTKEPFYVHLYLVIFPDKCKNTAYLFRDIPYFCKTVLYGTPLMRFFVI